MDDVEEDKGVEEDEDDEGKDKVSGDSERVSFDDGA